MEVDTIYLRIGDSMLVLNRVKVSIGEVSARNSELCIMNTGNICLLITRSSLKPYILVPKYLTEYFSKFLSN